MKQLCVLGSTGSIGVNTLDVAARHPDDVRIVALTANGNIERLADQCAQYRPSYAVVVDEAKHRSFQALLNDRGVRDVEVLAGAAALEQVASLPEVDTVMAAIVGAAGLLPTLAAARHGKRVLLANKEALVMSGPLFMDEIRQSGAILLPIDSEHNAIFQCMPAEYRAGTPAASVRKILLTASGGPFLRLPLEQFAEVTPEQAVAHPNWVMGRKISVDSATMMNKGLEVIEACLLFELEPSRVQVVVHPQSVIHSMVDYVDGSVLAQMGNPDMRIPIAHAMGWPDRVESGAEPLDLFKVGTLEFVELDTHRYPCLPLAYQAVSTGGTAPAILNAANEVAVASFLDGKIRFTGIAEAIQHCLDDVPHEPVKSLDDVLDADRRTRESASRYISNFALS